ncbi:MAG: hypothetical protein CMJ49_05705, partial [Planctomycetaceae bacterium]|nr:hypothetical protein [Planctomycetaceae bacterium]
MVVCGVLATAGPAQAGTEIIAETGDGAPDGNGTFSSFTSTSIVLNDAGQVAFHGLLSGTSGGAADNKGLFRSGGGSVAQIVRKGAAAPDGNGTFDTIGLPALNDSGQVAFGAGFSGTALGLWDDGGIVIGAGGAVVQIAREGEAPPDGNGVFSWSAFSPLPNLNDLGQVALVTTLTGTSGGGADDRAIYLGSAAGLVKVVREGDAAHDGDGVIGSFSGDASVNNLGQVAFKAFYSGNSGGAADDGVI